MTLVTGRSLSGKTALISQAYSDKPFLYFSLSGKTEALQTEEYVAQVRRKLDIHVSRTVLNFRLLMDYLFKVSSMNPMTIVLEDFDELLRRNPDYFAVLKSLWRSRRSTHVNLVLTISNPLNVAKIFDDPQAPLLNTLDMKINLGFLSLAQIKAEMTATGKSWVNEDLLTMYMLTGGCPKYVSYSTQRGIVKRADLLREFLCHGSVWLADIRMMVAESLGHNSEVYLSLLQLIASGVRSQGELEERLGGIIVGGHLAKLENDYCLITKTRPVLAGAKSRNVVRYEFTDQMTECWFRYAEALRDCIETGDFEMVTKIMDNDLPIYSKDVLRRYFRQKFVEENGFREIGGDWKAGKESVFEMDIVGVDRDHGHALLADVELSSDRFRKDPFLERCAALRDGPLKGYSVDTMLFTLNDM